jgi:DNA-binding MarR family transcriptional regulator
LLASSKEEAVERHTPPTPPSDPAVDRVAESMSHLIRQWRRSHNQLQASTKGPLFLCLGTLIKEGPMRSGALAEAVCSDPSTVSRQVAMLVEQGLVRREADPHDGRISVLAATDRGREAAAAMKRRRDALVASVMADWSPLERERFAELLARFLDGYRDAYPDFVAAVHDGEWTTLENGESA